MMTMPALAVADLWLTGGARQLSGSVDVYDTQTRSLIQVASTDWPAPASNTGTQIANDDGSYYL
jgi:hypothetical protein